MFRPRISWANIMYTKSSTDLGPDTFLAPDSREKSTVSSHPGDLHLVLNMDQYIHVCQHFYVVWMC